MTHSVTHTLLKGLHTHLIRQVIAPSSSAPSFFTPPVAAAAGGRRLGYQIATGQCQGNDLPDSEVVTLVCQCQCQ